jgi:hypothetical protein
MDFTYLLNINFDENINKTNQGIVNTTNKNCDKDFRDNKNSDEGKTNQGFINTSNKNVDEDGCDIFNAILNLERNIRDDIENLELYVKPKNINKNKIQTKEEELKEALENADEKILMHIIILKKSMYNELNVGEQNVETELEKQIKKLLCIKTKEIIGIHTIMDYYKKTKFYSKQIAMINTINSYDKIDLVYYKNKIKTKEEELKEALENADENTLIEIMILIKCMYHEIKEEKNNLAIELIPNKLKKLSKLEFLEKQIKKLLCIKTKEIIGIHTIMDYYKKTKFYSKQIEILNTLENLYNEIDSVYYTNNFINEVNLYNDIQNDDTKKLIQELCEYKASFLIEKVSKIKKDILNYILEISRNFFLLHKEKISIFEKNIKKFLNLQIQNEIKHSYEEYQTLYEWLEKKCKANKIDSSIFHRYSQQIHFIENLKYFFIKIVLYENSTKEINKNNLFLNNFYIIENHINNIYYFYYSGTDILYKLFIWISMGEIIIEDFQNTELNMNLLQKVFNEKINSNNISVDDYMGGINAPYDIDNLCNFFDSLKIGFHIVELHTKDALNKLLFNREFLLEFAKCCSIKIKANKVLNQDNLLYKKLNISINIFYYSIIFSYISNNFFSKLILRIEGNKLYNSTNILNFFDRDNFLFNIKYTNNLLSKFPGNLIKQNNIWNLIFRHISSDNNKFIHYKEISEEDLDRCLYKKVFKIGEEEVEKNYFNEFDLFNKTVNDHNDS